MSDDPPSVRTAVLCRACRFYNPSADGGAGRSNADKQCSRWRYGYSGDPLNGPSDILVEDDEGWGAIMGPEFGCVLGELADDAKRGNEP